MSCFACARDRLAVLLFALVATLPAQLPAASLNDTGQTQCFNGTNLVPCTAANSGDAATYPRQDGRFGRDARSGAGQLAKTGGGAGGFDFTPLDNSGTAIGLDGSGNPLSVPACVRDNVTGLIWEVKTADNGLRDKDYTYTWYDGVGGLSDGGNNCFTTTRCDTDKYIQDVQAAGLCGYSTGWRLPTMHELVSIVHHERSGASIDSSFFPNTVPERFWTSDRAAHMMWAYAWCVHFDHGENRTCYRGHAYAVRLVR